MASSNIVDKDMPELLAFDVAANLEEWVVYRAVSMPLALKISLHHVR